jgi:hypothetical protein
VPLGVVEEHELGGRALALEREAGEGLDGVLLGEPALRLDEALHVDLGHRREQHRLVAAPVERQPERDPLDDAIGVAGIVELHRQEQPHPAADRRGSRQDHVAREDLGTEFEHPRLGEREARHRERWNRQRQRQARGKLGSGEREDKDHHQGGKRQRRQSCVARQLVEQKVPAHRRNSTR